MSKENRENQVKEESYVMEEKFRGDWIPLKGVKATEEQIAELNRDSFRTNIRYVKGTFAKKGEKAAETEKPLADRSIAELKHYAGEKGIDLGAATKKADILTAIKVAESAGE